jgi:hypothetical protein
MKATSLKGDACAFTFVLAGALACAGAAAEPCPVKVPDGLKATPVADRLIVHSVAMSVAQVHGNEDAKAVLERTAAAWRQAGYQVRRGALVGWDIVAAKGKGCMVTLQLAQRRDSFGYLARSDDGRAAMPTARQRGVRLPPDAHIASSVASEDDGRDALVLHMASGRSLEQLGEFFRRELAEATWKAIRAHTVINGKTGAMTLFVTAQKGRDRVDIVIWPEQGSQIVMTISEAI